MEEYIMIHYEQFRKLYTSIYNISYFARFMLLKKVNTFLVFFTPSYIIIIILMNIKYKI